MWGRVVGNGNVVGEFDVPTLVNLLITMAPRKRSVYHPWVGRRRGGGGAGLTCAISSCRTSCSASAVTIVIISPMLPCSPTKSPKPLMASCKAAQRAPLPPLALPRALPLPLALPLALPLSVALPLLSYLS